VLKDQREIAGRLREPVRASLPEVTSPPAQELDALITAEDV
jgi:hypothetical protein